MNNLFMLDAAGDVEGTVNDVVTFFSADHINSLIQKGSDKVIVFFINVIIALIIWKLGKIAIKWIIKITCKALEHAKVDIGVSKFLASIITAVGYAVITLAILDRFGIQTASLIAVFGSAALAIGMSLQGSLSNFAGGILIMLFKPFKVGDYIVANNCEGTVVSIEILYTRLRTADSKLVLMPNGALSNSNITNVGGSGVRRVDIEIGISYSSDITKAKEVLKKAMEQNPEVDKKRELTVIVKSLDSSCVTLETRAWARHDLYWDVRFSLLEQYKIALDENNIEIPFNQLDVHLRQD